ncbi:DUF262 domain-containing protein [Hymenobacter cellulosilyticus]|uniref:DUF262 domain-containing protein n=1 Tax=Hymenobacter cellulosilyticus TaxID=2932248 RepID=A0A8T9QED3_9BACT|nr:DUF262 domain-containing protein [Hymenobacter cellulosilyticus]UOQ75222.1 DUF262 domain-containing protein [Hymenobacter cellulosilyticus]
MSPTQTTFWSLLNDYSIRIPIIQRDYAQGRDDKTTAVIRNKFLHSLHKTLLANNRAKPLDLDFVYGEVKHPDEAKLRYMIPLDGQQRLTTLYLLHWYLAVAEGRLEEVKHVLQKFTYQTRSSSREFCDCLAKCEPADITLGVDQPLSEQLRDAAWFQPAWQRDPTVQAMLTMLDAISEKFGTPVGLFDQLTESVDPLIGFQFLELDKVGLTDDLYLKMNARGKALTDFENWKAEFDQFLHLHHPERQGEFAQRIDGPWTDLFWHHQQGSPDSMDTAFRRFLEYVTTMLGVWRSGVKVQEEEEEAAADPFELYRKVYTDADNVHFLFRALDLLSPDEVRNTDVFFREVFSKTQKEDKVVLFDGGLNLFTRIINGANPDIKVRVLLFALLNYGVTIGSLRGDDPELHDLLRVVRNQLERVRQLKDTKFGPVLREDAMPSYLADAAALVSLSATGQSVNVYELLAKGIPARLRSGPRFAPEIEKAKLILQNPALKSAVHQLEDLAVFKGSLHSLSLEEHQESIGDFAAAAKEIWSGAASQEQIIRAWLTIDDYSLNTGGSRLGDKYFFGSDENWYTMLTSSDTKIKDLLPRFLSAYLSSPGATATERLLNMVDAWLAKEQEMDWRYYFIKYPRMTEDSSGQYAWESSFEMRLLSRSSLRAFHINPYVRTVIGLVADNSKCSEYDSGTSDAYKSPLWCNRVSSGEGATQYVGLYCEDDGWRVRMPEGYVPAEELASMYGLQSDLKGRLQEDPSTDRIQTALAFIDDLYKFGISPAVV